MDKGRLEAFSDGVLAVIITIMVLELAPPHAPTLGALAGQWPVFVSYVLSFVYVGIYWNNHHHMLKGVERIDGRAMWANLHLLFWISLFPFTTAWMSENSFAPLPTALYGAVLLLAALAWPLLGRALVAANGPDCPLARVHRRGGKERMSIVLYLVAVPLALIISPWLACALYAVVAALWFVPDRRMEKIVAP